jgi:hypothetical protein
LKEANSELQAKDKVPFLQDVITQCGQESQEKQDAKKKFDKNISEKDDENICLRDLNQRFLAQIKEIKYEKHNHKLQQGSQDLKKKFDKNLLEKYVAQGCLSCYF